MKLFVANTKNQNEHFHYRIPGNNKLMSQHIEAGKQVQIYGDLQPEEIGAIIAQHEMYGMIEASKVKAEKSFIGLCFSTDKPVTLNAIQMAFSHNDEVLDERGKQIRKITAVAIDDALDKMTPGKLRASRSEIIEDEQRGQESRMAEGIEVTRSAKGRKR